MHGEITLTPHRKAAAEIQVFLTFTCPTTDNRRPFFRMMETLIYGWKPIGPQTLVTWSCTTSVAPPDQLPPTGIIDKSSSADRQRPTPGV
uniref:Uncharacterized protein n=1 Tax=Nothobranchius pienaari TaxID=704102 RepID=A0A1A8LSN0_9TELE